MPISVDQVDIDTSNTNQAGIANIVFSTDVVAGDLLVFACGGFATGGDWGISQVSDDVNGNWTQAIERDSGSNSQVEIWYYQNAGAGTTTVSVTEDGSGIYYAAGIMRVSGMATASALDTTGSASAGSGAPTVTADATSSQADTLLVAMANVPASGTGAWTDPSDTDGYTLWFEDSDGSQFNLNNACYKVESAAAQETAPWSKDSDATSYYTVIAVFKGAAAGTRPQGPLGHPFRGPFAGPIS